MRSDPQGDITELRELRAEVLRLGLRSADPAHPDTAVDFASGARSRRTS